MQAKGPPPKNRGERPHKIGSKFDPFRTTRTKSPHIRLPLCGSSILFPEYQRLESAFLVLLPCLSCVASPSLLSGNLERHRTLKRSTPSRMTFPSPSRKASAARSNPRKGILSASLKLCLKTSIPTSP